MDHGWPGEALVQDLIRRKNFLGDTTTFVHGKGLGIHGNATFSAGHTSVFVDVYDLLFFTFGIRIDKCGLDWMMEEGVMDTPIIRKPSFLNE